MAQAGSSSPVLAIIAVEDISEEDQAESWVTEENRSKLARYRGDVKRTHTKQRTAISQLISQAVGWEELLAERRLLVHDFDNMLPRHLRLLKSSTAEEAGKEEKWFQTAAADYQEALVKIDSYLVERKPPRRALSSQRSSSSCSSHHRSTRPGSFHRVQAPGVGHQGPGGRTAPEAEPRRGQETGGRRATDAGHGG